MLFHDSGVRVKRGESELAATFAFQKLEILPVESNWTFQLLTEFAPVFFITICICAPDPQSLTSFCETESTPEDGVCVGAGFGEGYGVGLAEGEGLGDGYGVGLADGEGIAHVQPVPHPPRMVAFLGAGGAVF